MDRKEFGDSVSKQISYRNEMVKMGRPRTPLIERFLSKVNVNGGIPEFRPDLGPCWEWLGTKGLGYGLITVGPTWRSHRAHRVSYRLFVGPIPADLYVDHLCRVKHCVNPNHLQPVTNVENVARGLKGALRWGIMECPQGHPYSGDNLYIETQGKGWRHCKTCMRQHYRTWKARQRMAGPFS